MLVTASVRSNAQAMTPGSATAAATRDNAADPGLDNPSASSLDGPRAAISQRCEVPAIAQAPQHAAQSRSTGSLGMKWSWIAFVSAVFSTTRWWVVIPRS